MLDHQIVELLRKLDADDIEEQIETESAEYTYWTGKLEGYDFTLCGGRLALGVSKHVGFVLNHLSDLDKSDTEKELFNFHCGLKAYLGATKNHGNN